MASALCAVCYLSRDWKPGGQIHASAGELTRRSVAEWTKSSRNGCHSCETILEGCIGFLRKESPYKPQDLSIGPPTEWGPSAFVVEMGYYKRSKQEDINITSLVVEFYMTNGKSSRQTHSVTSRHVGSTARPAINFLRAALRECEESHSECAKISPRLPKRILEIAASKTSIQLVLLEFAENSLPVYGKYVALSHCWGRGQPFKLLTENINELKSGINYDKLSSVFQDAIETTKRLGLRHLWIDALCIIQNDQVDWEVESAAMGSIFRNAHVTIAASSSSDGDQTFLDRERARSHVGISASGIEYVGTKESGPTLFIRRVLHDNIDDGSHLDKRGWAFQEYLTSSRIVQFSEREAFFHCSRGRICECGTEISKPNSAVALNDDSAGNRARGEWQAAFQGFVRPTLSKAKYLRLWASVASSYSGRDLTFDTDRLPALSGLASQYRTRPGSPDKPLDYAAGLWREQFQFFLGWYTAHKMMPATETYLAPSWSWASLRYYIYYRFGNPDHITFHLRVVDVVCHTKGANIFGQVDSGFAILKGRVQEYRLFSQIGNYYVPDALLSRDGQAFVRNDSLLELSTCRQEDGKFVQTVRRSMRYSPAPIDGECTVWIMCLMQEKKPASLEATFLVFGKPKSSSDDFERIGILHREYLDNSLQGGFNEEEEFLMWLETATPMTMRII